MNKSLEGLLRGYVFYTVNERKFYLYNSALKYKSSLEGGIIFNGFSIIKGTRCFYLEFEPTKFEQIPKEDAIKRAKLYYESAQK